MRNEPMRNERLLEDPLAIRALAHPLRLDLLAAVSRAGRITTAEAAREVEVSHGLASHHLRQLAKYGFIEQVPGKDNRERPWRPTASTYRWPDKQPTTAAADATDVLEQVMAERVLEDFLRWQQRRSEWSDDWLDGSGIGTCTLHLTAAELASLTAEFEAMVGRYTRDRDPADAADQPPGTAPVDIAYFAVPVGRPAPEA
ncbi:MAG TPA: helix-turn-helix domain-containing protein [Streptosporangiaceae bacterium]|jgi:DNA-binding transcriptional ArsR family regulator